MRIQWDSALVGATARALDRRFGGARIRAWHLDPVRRRMALYLRDAVLAWDLHPERTGMRVLAPVEPPQEARPLPARVERIWSPPDDRVLVVETRRLRGRPSRGRIVLELLPNRENAVVCEGDEDVVRAILRTREGDAPLRRGHPYRFPAPSGRAGQTEDPGDATWRAIAALEGDEAKRALLREIAWTSPLTAEAILDEGGRLLLARLRDAAGVGEGAAAAAVVLGRWGPQPYPAPLPDRTLEETDDLLAAFARAAEASDAAPSAEILLPGILLERLAAAVDRARGRVARLEEELAALEDPERLRRWGDLLLARFHLVPAGEDAVELEDFEGGSVRIPLDPALSPDANARRLYDRAARIRRAREQLPARIREARTDVARLAALTERLHRGEAGREEVEEALPAGQAGGGEDAPTLPFRRFRSSGGLEIRVGRGASRNDDLTFRHSRPNDVWLHARHAAGAHVILRWDGPGAPPARDLEEAAVLAALHSRARTSGSVPVDWTLRKHVRKPRKAPPGSVVPDQVKTLFVKPDDAMAERLRED